MTTELPDTHRTGPASQACPHYPSLPQEPHGSQKVMSASACYVGRRRLPTYGHLDCREPASRRQGMDQYATLARPVHAVFSCLASPACLDDWLCEVAAALAGPGRAAGIGEKFRLRVRIDAAEIEATGEVTAVEPPWLVGLLAVRGSRTYLLRASCAARDRGTRVHLHQAADGAPFTSPSTSRPWSGPWRPRHAEMTRQRPDPRASAALSRARDRTRALPEGLPHTVLRAQPEGMHKQWAPSSPR